MKTTFYTVNWDTGKIEEIQGEYLGKTFFGKKQAQIEGYRGPVIIDGYPLQIDSQIFASNYAILKNTLINMIKEQIEEVNDSLQDLKNELSYLEPFLKGIQANP